MSKKPTHTAYVVSEGKEGAKGFWREVGAVFPHGKGTGFDLVIHEQISVSGRIVCTERKEKQAEEQPEGLIEQQCMFMTVHEHGVQCPVEVLARSNA